MKARCATLARGINPARQGSTPTYIPPLGWLFIAFSTSLYYIGPLLAEQPPQYIVIKA